MFIGDVDSKAETHDAIWWNGEFDQITEEEAEVLKKQWTGD